MRYLSVFLFVISAVVMFGQDADWHKAKENSRFLKLWEADQIQYPGDDTYDVTFYKLDLTITYSPQYVDGIVTVTAKPSTAPIDHFFLDLQNNMTVDSVKSNGVKLSFTHSSDKLNITLDQSVGQGVEFSVDVYYQGRPNDGGFGSFEFDTHSGTPVIWSLSEPYGAPYWFPVKDTPGDKADSVTVWITCPTEYTPVSNGKLREIIDLGNGMHQYRWRSKYPIAQYLISVALTNYSEHTQYFKYSDTDSMLVIHYLYPESAGQALNYVSLTPQMLQAFSNVYGLYPFIDEKYGHAQCGFGGGMEHQTLTSIGSFSEGIVAHELSHQWFGDKITCADWHNIWLNEGFATYSEAVWYEQAYGWTRYKQKIMAAMSSAKNAEGSIWVQDISSLWEIFSSSRSYNKGATVLHMLRGVVGDSTFYKILRTYSDYPGIAFNSVVTADFQNVAEEVSGVDLDYFFSEWIYGENYPVYSVDWNYYPASHGRYTVQVEISQESNTSPTFFTMPVQLKFNFSSGDTTITVFNDQSTQTFELTIDQKPYSVNLDPDNWILKEIGSITSSDDTEMSVNEFKLEQNYPNPFNPNTTIKFSIPGNSETLLAASLRVYDILGREVAVLVNEQKAPGVYKVVFDANNLSSGIYFYKLSAGDFNQIKKMILLR